MPDRPWVTVALLAVIAVLLALLLVVRVAPPAQAQVSEGRADHVIAVASDYGDASLLYVIDTSREVILLYGLQNPGQQHIRDVRTAAFEFLAGRLYQWDILLSTKREYSVRGIRTLQGLRVFGPGSSEEEYHRLEK